MAKKQPTVLITGGTGFLGTHLARFFLKKNWNTVLLDIAPLAATDLEGKVTVLNIDTRNKKEVYKALQGVDYVVHAAAALPIHLDKNYIFSVNVDGTKNVLDAALKQKVKRVIFISTTAMYGVPRKLPEEETDSIYPIGFYGQSKAEGEKLCMSYFKKGLSVNIIRPKTFLGPERLGVFTLWFEAIFQNKPVFILGKGNNLYQLLEVTDLCEAIYSALNIKQDGEIFNVGTQDFGTWKQDLTALIKHAKSGSKLLFLPVLPTQTALALLETLHLSPIVAWHYKTFPVNSYVSTEKAEKILNFKSTKSNNKILIESYDWYKKHRQEFIHQIGKTHKTVWNFKVLEIVNKFL